MGHEHQSSRARRGTVVVFTTVSLTLVIGFAALAVDVGYAYAVKAELQRTADAAALAGVAAFTDDSILLADYNPTADAASLAQSSAAMHAVDGKKAELPSSDIVVGFLNDPLDKDEVVDVSAMPNTFNTVQVTLRREANVNGEIPLFFASIFGFSSMSLKASATAAVEDGFSGFRPPESGPSPLLPFSVSKEKYDEEMASGDDLWSYDSGQGAPSNNPDGRREVWIYPVPETNTNGNGNGGNGNTATTEDGGDGGGNFGTLNIGVGNQGTEELGQQVLNGLTQQDLVDEVGSENLEFIDATGNPVAYTMTGNPGLSGGVTADIEARVGDIVGFFLHDGVTMNGSNADFNIIGMRFGRLMEVHLTGQPAERRVVIQPEPYAGPGVRTSPLAASSGRMILSLRLTR